MIQRYISIGARKWGVVICFEITKSDLPEISHLLDELGAKIDDIYRALRTIQAYNSAFTFSDEASRMSLVCIGRSTSDAEMFDSVMHEVKHVVEHVSNYYGVDAKSEDAAYLQGEVARQLYLRTKELICPKCKKSYTIAE